MQAILRYIYRCSLRLSGHNLLANYLLTFTEKLLCILEPYSTVLSKIVAGSAAMRIQTRYGAYKGLASSPEAWNYVFRFLGNHNSEGWLLAACVNFQFPTMEDEFGVCSNTCAALRITTTVLTGRRVPGIPLPQKLFGKIKSWMFVKRTTSNPHSCIPSRVLHMRKQALTCLLSLTEHNENFFRAFFSWLYTFRIGWTRPSLIVQLMIQPNDYVRPCQATFWSNQYWWPGRISICSLWFAPVISYMDRKYRIL